MKLRQHSLLRIEQYSSTFIYHLFNLNLVSVLKSPTEVGWFTDQQWLNNDLQKW